jgi:hypothetical protein
MKIEIEIPDKYADQLEAVEEVDPSVREQIEIEVLPEVLRLITDAHRQLEQQQSSLPDQESGDG